MTVSIEHIEIDEAGTARIAGSRSRVTNVVADMLNGLTPVQIHEQYPHLSLAQIHAALAYYYDHKQEIDARMESDIRGHDSLRQRSAQPSRDELLNRRRASGGIEE